METENTIPRTSALAIGYENMTNPTSTRLEKAMKILELDDPIHEVENGIFTVKSQSGYGLYKVDSGEWKCNCPDYITRGGERKHILATRYYLEVQRETVSGTISEKIPIAPSQAWSAYNQAQVMEGEIFEKLLRELCDTIPEPTQEGAGRPSIPMADQVFCAVMKSYSMMSSRRAHTFLRDAEKNGTLVHAPHFNQVSKTMLGRDITSTLLRLIRKSAVPLASVETDFAVDSSDFSTSKFNAYCGAKHGVKKQHDWIKAHVCTGVITNIVTDVIITNGHGADCPQFEDLVKHTAEYFDINEVSADKAYSSRQNFEVVNDLGGDAMIPFKSNSSSKPKGSKAWRNAYHYFQMHRDEFEARYHKMSNVESTFGAIKAKFGENLKSKKWTA